MSRFSRKDAEHVQKVIRFWGDNCRICCRPADDVSHLRPKGMYPELRYNLRNTVPMCRDHHRMWHGMTEDAKRVMIESYMPCCLKTFIKAKRVKP